DREEQGQVEADVATKATAERATEGRHRGPPRARRPDAALRVEQQLGDLDRIRGRAFAQLVADHPEAQSIRARKILTDAADEAVVLSLDRDGHGIAVLRGIVPELESGESREQIAGAPDRDLRLGLGGDRDRVRREYRDSHR